MRLRIAVSRVMMALALIGISQVGLAAAKTLIELTGGKPTPGLAKTWKKVKDGEYEFQLDTTQELKKGTPVSGAAVKESLESKLGSAYGVKVADKGGGKVSVAYTGDEQKFLEQVAKAKIRGGKDVEVALESSVSDGGIRAKKIDRPAAPDEVKGIVLKVEAGLITAKVNETKSAKVKASETVKIKGDVKGLKKNDKIFFKPEAKEGDAWVPVAGTLQ